MKQKPKKGWSMSTAGTFMTDKAVARHAGMIAVVVAEALVKVLSNRFVVSSFYAFGPWGWLCRCFRRSRPRGLWCDVKCPNSQLGWIIGKGQCDWHQGMFSSCPYIASLVLLCRDDQWKACRIVWSWAGDDYPFWKRVLPSISRTSVAQLLYWWPLPV